MIYDELEVLLAKWREWAVGTDRSENGWESDFPEWRSLLASAAAHMRAEPTGCGALEALAECWAMSAETEELLDDAVSNIDETWPMLQKLAVSSLSACRWQVYVASVAAGRPAEGILRAGLADRDSYCKRRAFLGLSRLAPSDAGALAAAALLDEDPYMRQAALAMALASRDDTCVTRIREQLSCDPVKHVRDAVEGPAPTT